MFQLFREISMNVGVHAKIAEMLIEKTNNSKLKTKKVRIVWQLLER